MNRVIPKSKLDQKLEGRNPGRALSAEGDSRKVNFSLDMGSVVPTERLDLLTQGLEDLSATVQRNAAENQRQLLRIQTELSKIVSEFTNALSASTGVLSGGSDVLSGMKDLVEGNRSVTSQMKDLAKEVSDIKIPEYLVALSALRTEVKKAREDAATIGSKSEQPISTSNSTPSKMKINRDRQGLITSIDVIPEN